MGLIYGNTFINKEESIITYESFIDFFNESMEEHDKIFESFMFEAETLQLTDSQHKDTKKGILETIKNLFQKFITFVKRAVQKVMDWYKDIQEGKYKDILANKLLKDLKYEDLETAKKNGWKGIPEQSSFAMIDPARIQHELYMFENVKEEIRNNKITEIIESIKSVEKFEEAKEKYKEVQESISNLRYYDFKPGSIHLMKFRAGMENISRRHKRSFGDNKQDVQLILLYHTTIQNGFWYPDTRGFGHVKDYTFNGASNISRYSKELYKYVSDYDKAYVEPIEKSIANATTSNADNDQSRDLLYNKAQLSVAQYVMKVYTGIIKETLDALKVQHSVAIGTYIFLFTNTRKFLKKAVEPKASEAN